MGEWRLPVLTARELIRVLKRAGFIEHHQRGSHLTLRREADGRRVTIPVHAGRTIKRGTLKGILADADITPTDLERLR
jgi:predicted RNA binding protein YcfA (HicA-like mRNA interferase family)